MHSVYITMLLTDWELQQGLKILGSGLTAIGNEDWVSISSIENGLCTIEYEDVRKLKPDSSISLFVDTLDTQETPYLFQWKDERLGPWADTALTRLHN